VRSQEGGFIVSMPLATPAITEERAHAAHWNSRTNAWERRDGMTHEVMTGGEVTGEVVAVFQAGYRDYDREAVESVGDLLANSADRIKTPYQVGSKTVLEKEIGQDDRPGLELTVKGADGLCHRARLYRVGERVLIADFAYQGSSPQAEQAAERFLDSFKLDSKK
jgi:hypothetical protein